MAALNAAKSGGASYADVRIGRYRSNFVFTREQQIVNVVDTDSIGARRPRAGGRHVGLRRDAALTKDGVAAAAREAVAIAKANRIARDHAGAARARRRSYPDATWKSAYTIDPFTIPIEQTADLLLKANAEAMKVKGVQFVVQRPRSS